MSKAAAYVRREVLNAFIGAFCAISPQPMPYYGWNGFKEIVNLREGNGKHLLPIYTDKAFEFLQEDLMKHLEPFRCGCKGLDDPAFTGEVQKSCQKLLNRHFKMADMVLLVPQTFVPSAEPPPIKRDPTYVPYELEIWHPFKEGVYLVPKNYFTVHVASPSFIDFNQDPRDPLNGCEHLYVMYWQIIPTSTLTK